MKRIRNIADLMHTRPRATADKISPSMVHFNERH